MIAFSRPFWPLFLHVLGAMVLVGAILAVLVLTIAAWRRPQTASLRSGTLQTLLFVAIPAWVVMRIGAEWIWSNEKDVYPKDPTWVGIGLGVADGGLLVLLITTGVAFWWRRSSKPVAGRIVTGLAGFYLLLLAVAWLAMSGKWS